jgi:hypothetical protein
MMTVQRGRQALVVDDSLAVRKAMQLNDQLQLWD